MLGQALMAEARARGVDVIGLARSNADMNVDICDDMAVCKAISGANADIVINSAALVDIGKCEADEAVAYRINTHAVEVMADACQKNNIRFVQISTDHLYSGDGHILHDENAPVKLMNAYARTKYAAEALALKHAGTLVVRTNITGFRGLAGHPTFLEWVIGALQAGEHINAFDDYFMSTIDTPTFATALFDLIDIGAHGIINLACCEGVNKKMFIEEVAKALGLHNADIEAAHLSSLVPRRGDSLGLDVSKAEKLLGRPLPTMAKVVETLIEEFKRRS